MKKTLLISLVLLAAIATSCYKSHVDNKTENTNSELSTMNNVTQINISYTTPNNDEYLLTDIQKVSNNVWEMTQTHYTSNNEMYSYINEFN